MRERETLPGMGRLPPQRASASFCVVSARVGLGGESVMMEGTERACGSWKCVFGEGARGVF